MDWSSFRMLGGSGMMCITLRGKSGNDKWQGSRSVEILGYHDNKQRVEILFTLYLKNLSEDGEPNFLEFLHPGNTLCASAKSWPVERHPDEPEGKPYIIESVYGKAFKTEKNKLYQMRGLSAWDSWYDNYGREPVVIWPDQEKHLRKRNFIKRVFPSPRSNDFIPFTIFELGPFTTEGPVLIAFKLWFGGETYSRLVGRNETFTVDGPEALLLRIERDYIRNLKPVEQKEWIDRLEPFRNYISMDESYDIIVVNSGLADNIECVRKSGIMRAPIQPASDKKALRYITANPRFALSLRYSKDVLRRRRKAIVGPKMKRV